MAKNYNHGNLPEIVMEGSHVIHTDEDGNMLLNEDSDQRLSQKQQEFQQFDELFDAVVQGSDVRAREKMAEFLRDDEISMEGLEGLFGTGSSKS
jgi:hypothetical protein